MKTYQAYTMAEALSAVRQDLGETAVILNTRTFKRGGLLGLGRRTVIEVTATEPQPQGGGMAAVPKATPAARAYAATLAPGTAAGNLAAKGALDRSEPPVRTEADRERTRRMAQAIIAEHERSKTSRQGASSDAGTAAAVAAVLLDRPEAPVSPSQADANRSSISHPLRTNGPRGTRGSRSTPDRDRSDAIGNGPVAPAARRFVLKPRGDASLSSPAGMTIVKPAAPVQSPRAAARPDVTAPTAGASATIETKATTLDEPVFAITEPLRDVRSEPSREPAVVLAPAEPRSPAPSAPAPADSTASPRLSPSRERTSLVELYTGRESEEPTATGDSNQQSMQDELAAIKAMVGQVLQRQTTAIRSGAPVVTSPSMPALLFQAYLKLIGQELSEELADRVVNEVRDELEPFELEDESRVRAAVIRHLADFIPTASSGVPDRGSDGRPVTIAMVGPTGVGKTTTLAKLAASFKLRYGKRVGLITSDTYRIAAVDQLRTYATIIGLPLEVVLTPAEMSRAVARMNSCDVILIDSAGRSQNDHGRIGELKAFIDAARPHEVHLVLSSTAGERVLKREAEAFGAVGIDKIVLTKLDEAASFGVLVNAVREIGKPLSFVTTGQEVPDHIEVGKADRLAELVLGGALNA